MNGYCQIEIAGRKVGLKFNMYAIEQMESIKGNTGTIKNFTSVIWAGLLGNAYAKQTEPDLTFEQVNDWVDEQLLSNDEGGQLGRISETFAGAQVIQKLQARVKGNGEVESEELKKKVILPQAQD